MDKQELHDMLSNEDNLEINIHEQVFIDIYGKDDTRKIQGRNYNRADILATVHGLKVNKEGSNYIFIRES